MDSLLEQRIQYFERLLSSKTRSPIVVQLAALYLEAGRPHDALRYCDSGIAHFPYYTTAHLVRAKVLQALDMKAEARRELELVHSILPDVEGVKAMLEKLPDSDAATFDEASAPVETEDASASASQAGQVAVASPSEEEARLEDLVHNVDETTRTDSFAEQPRAAAERAEQQEQGHEEDAFGLGLPESGGPPVESIYEPEVPPEPVVPETDSARSLEAEAPGQAAPSAPEEYEQFAARMKEELDAGGDALTLQDFFAPASDQVQEPPAADKIEELAEKLKSAPRITPIIDISDKKTIPPSEEDTLASMEFVTPTLAEIYAKQGWYDDAIRAYRILIRIKPAERERFERRIQELENLKKAEEGAS